MIGWAGVHGTSMLAPHAAPSPPPPPPPQLVLLVPWMWFGAIFLATIAVTAFTVVAYSCARLRELAMPLGLVGLLAAAGCQLPGWVLLARRLDGDAAVPPAAILGPMAAGWAGMWAAALVLAAGLAWKERLRARLAAAGRTWTADDATHRSVMRSDVAEAQRMVDAMSDRRLARVTGKLMRVRGAASLGRAPLRLRRGVSHC